MRLYKKLKGDYADALKTCHWLDRGHRAPTLGVYAFTSRELINGFVEVIIRYPNSPTLSSTIVKAGVLGKSGWKIDLKAQR